MTVENFSAELSENGKKTRSRDGSDDDDSDENDHEDSKLSSLNDSIPTGLTGSDSAGDFVLFDVRLPPSLSFFLMSFQFYFESRGLEIFFS